MAGKGITHLENKERVAIAFGKIVTHAFQIRDKQFALPTNITYSINRILKTSIKGGTTCLTTKL